MKEYIVPVEEDEADFEEVFIAYIRKQTELILCKDCIHNVANRETDPNDITDYSGTDIVCDYFMTDGLDPDDYCSKAERKEE